MFYCVRFVDKDNLRKAYTAYLVTAEIRAVAHATALIFDFYAQMSHMRRYPEITATSENGIPIFKKSDVLTS